ncbi:high affinity immunoglobulin epsilon receptor subunit gamma-like [Sardina pilchardus]|uniref:high affinity immunoglobulin epsilon receptor subunit gamma-like n=1 Tax=Sardina pilchardus TaxID=27697 RepID=UPI002E0D85A4
MKVSEVILVLSLYIHGVTANMGDDKLCYILDAILVLYGIVLTVLYCRLRMSPAPSGKSGVQAGAGEGIYQGLTPHAQDTYETIQVKKM